jgi:hypothetical protein
MLYQHFEIHRTCKAALHSAVLVLTGGWSADEVDDPNHNSNSTKRLPAVHSSGPAVQK